MTAQISNILRVRGLRSLGGCEATPPDHTYLQPSWASQVPDEPRTHPPPRGSRSFPQTPSQLAQRNKSGSVCGQWYLLCICEKESLRSRAPVQTPLAYWWGAAPCFLTWGAKNCLFQKVCFQAGEEFHALVLSSINSWLLSRGCIYLASKLGYIITKFQHLAHMIFMCLIASLRRFPGVYY